MDRFVLSLIVIIGGITGFVLYQIFSSEAPVSSTFCLPKDISQLNLDFHVNTPSVLPDGYSLQGIEILDHAPYGIILNYANHSMCLHTFSEDDVNLLRVLVRKEHNTEGHAIFSPTGQMLKYEKIQLPPMTSLKFQQETIKTVLSLGLNRTLTWKAVDINSYKGLTVLSMREPAVIAPAVVFLNDNDQTLYTVTGNLPLNQLLAVARSMHAITVPE